MTQPMITQTAVAPTKIINQHPCRRKRPRPWGRLTPPPLPSACGRAQPPRCCSTRGRVRNTVRTWGSNRCTCSYSPQHTLCSRLLPGVACNRHRSAAYSSYRQYTQYSLLLPGAGDTRRRSAAYSYYRQHMLCFRLLPGAACTRHRSVAWSAAWSAACSSYRQYTQCSRLVPGAGDTWYTSAATATRTPCCHCTCTYAHVLGSQRDVCVTLRRQGGDGRGCKGFSPV